MGNQFAEDLYAFIRSNVTSNNLVESSKKAFGTNIKSVLNEEKKKEDSKVQGDVKPAEMTNEPKKSEVEKEADKETPDIDKLTQKEETGEQKEKEIKQEGSDKKEVKESYVDMWNGRRFNTISFNSPESANSFLKKNPDYGVIAEIDGIVHVAKNKDKGVKKEVKEGKKEQDELESAVKHANKSEQDAKNKKEVEKGKKKLKEDYKSDEDIEKEFANFKILKIDVKPSGSSGWIDIEFPEGDEHVGGGTTDVSDNWIKYPNGKIAFGNWYPEKVYLSLVNAIKDKISPLNKNEGKVPVNPGNVEKPEEYIKNLSEADTEEKVIAAGITDETVAKDLATRKNGTAVQDPQSKLWKVTVKESKVQEDTEVNIKTDDKEIQVTEVPQGGVQTTVIEKPTAVVATQGAVEAPEVEEVEGEEEEVEESKCKCGGKCKESKVNEKLNAVDYIIVDESFDKWVIFKSRGSAFIELFTFDTVEEADLKAKEIARILGVEYKGVKNKKNESKVNEATKIKREKYTWGNLRVITKDSDFSVVIHPNDFGWIQSHNEGTFKDEQGVTWKFVKTGEDITFTSDSKTVTVKYKDLVMNESKDINEKKYQIVVDGEVIATYKKEETAKKALKDYNDNHSEMSGKAKIKLVESKDDFTFGFLKSVIEALKRHNFTPSLEKVGDFLSKLEIENLDAVKKAVVDNDARIFAAMINSIATNSPFQLPEAPAPVVEEPKAPVKAETVKEPEIEPKTEEPVVEESKKVIKDEKVDKLTQIKKTKNESKVNEESVSDVEDESGEKKLFTKQDLETPEDEESLEDFELTDDLLNEILEEFPELNDFDIEEVRKGIETEKEHLEVTQGCPFRTAMIALDHLREIPDYYTRLVAMEEEAKSEEQVKEPIEEPVVEEAKKCSKK